METSELTQKIRDLALGDGAHAIGFAPVERFDAPPSAVLAGFFRGDFQSNWYALGEGDTELVIPPAAGDMALMRRERHRYAPELTRVVLPLHPASHAFEDIGRHLAAQMRPCTTGTVWSFMRNLDQDNPKEHNR